MIPSRVIEAKRDGERIDGDTLARFFGGYLDGSVTEYQMSAFLMAVYFRGLEGAELSALTRIMIASGSTLDLSDLDGPRIDKHSTGGVGDKVSLALAPLVAASGVYVPMMSGRGLGHTGGTLDKLEAIPGFRTDLSLLEFESTLRSVGCAMIGQTDEIAPLDRRLYDLRNVSGSVSSIPLIAASIMSKKLAEGLTGLVLDVKVGEGAFIPEEERALELAETMVGIGSSHGVPTTALATAMDRPLGRAVGNGLETAEAVRCLQGEGPHDLRELVLSLATEMVALGAATTDGSSPGSRDVPTAEARRRVVRALDDGSALDRFRRLVEAQGGDPRVADDPEDVLPAAPEVREVTAPRAGWVSEVTPTVLGNGVVTLGGGRTHLGDEIDSSVGFVLHRSVGDPVEAGDVLALVHARTPEDAGRGEEIARSAFRIDGREASPGRPLISHRVTGDGVSRLAASRAGGGEGDARA